MYHRAELTALERSKLVAEWCELVGKSQVAQPDPPKPQYQKQGDREASRQLNLSRGEIQRSKKVASDVVLAPGND